MKKSSGPVGGVRDIEVKMDARFTKNVVLYRRRPDGEFVTNEQGEKIVEHELGTFVFRRPGVQDELEMRIDRIKRLRGLKLDDLDDATKLYLEYCIYFPRLCVEAPRDWNWEVNDPMAIVAISDAFAEGFTEVG